MQLRRKYNVAQFSYDPWVESANWMTEGKYTGGSAQKTVGLSLLNWGSEIWDAEVGKAINERYIRVKESYVEDHGSLQSYGKVLYGTIPGLAPDEKFVKPGDLIEDQQA